MDGQWKLYDPNGDLLFVMVWNNGQFVLRKERQDDRWVEKTFAQLDPILQEEIQQTMESAPSGPISTRPNEQTTQIEALELPDKQAYD